MKIYCPSYVLCMKNLYLSVSALIKQNRCYSKLSGLSLYIYRSRSQGEIQLQCTFFYYKYPNNQGFYKKDSDCLFLLRKKVITIPFSQNIKDTGLSPMATDGTCSQIPQTNSDEWNKYNILYYLHDYFSLFNVTATLGI